MLPEQLSNDACSLCPHEDRLTMTVDIVIREDGSVMSYECFPAVIRSCARLDYGQVQAFLDGDTADAAAVERARHIPQEVHSRLLGLDRIARQLEVQRRRAGALDLDSAEAHVVLDENGTPVDVAVRRTTRATSLVEQAMILANACVAMYLETRGWPCLYRVHEAPSPESLVRLLPILQEYGLDKGIDRDLFEAGDPKTLQEVLEAARKADAGELVSMLLLRSLKRACYEPHVAQHFGLALQRYAHFTSPIRRYPDLVVHRMLVAQLRGDTEAAERIAPHLQEIADRSSAMERVADDAARESQELKLVEYLQNFIGEDSSPGIDRGYRRLRLLRGIGEYGRGLGGAGRCRRRCLCAERGTSDADGTRERRAVPPGTARPGASDGGAPGRTPAGFLRWSRSRTGGRVARWTGTTNRRNRAGMRMPSRR